MADDNKDHIAKALRIAAQVKVRIDKIKKAVDEFQQDMVENIQKAQDAVTNNVGRSQKAIDAELEKLSNKYDEKHKKAQEWVDDQLKSLKEWVDDQIDSVQDELKKSKARAEKQILECSSGKNLTEDELNALIKAVPDVPLPKPDIPKISIPKPPFPYPNLNLNEIAGELMEASGANDIMDTSKNLAATKLI